MKRNTIITILTTCLFAVSASAQQMAAPSGCQIEDAVTACLADSVDLPVLTQEFYNGVNFLNKDLDYETSNKIRRLTRMRWDAMTMAIGAGAVAIILTNYIGANNHWATWSHMAAGYAAAGAVVVPFILWSSNLKKRAESLSAQTAYVYRLNSRLNLGASRFSGGLGRQPIAGLGLGMKFSF